MIEFPSLRHKGIPADEKSELSPEVGADPDAMGACDLEICGGATEYRQNSRASEVQLVMIASYAHGLGQPTRARHQQPLIVDPTTAFHQFNTIQRLERPHKDRSGHILSLGCDVEHPLRMYHVNEGQASVPPH